MNSRQLQYAVLLAENRSFSNVADDLDISQPALSKQIIHLENELGVKLFDRSTNPLSLTPAGEFFIQKAQELLFEEDVLMKTMEQFKTGENGKLRIGVSPFRSLYLMPPLVKALKERFPGLKVVLSEHGRAQLHKGINEGLYDFIITNLPVDDSRLDIVHLEKDTLVLAVPNDLLELIDPNGYEVCDGQAFRLLHLSACASLPFAVVSPGQEMRQLFDRLCKLSRIEPDIYVEVTGIATAWTMVQAGLAAAILPRQFVQAASNSQEITLLEINQDTYVRQPAIVTRRGQFISEYARYAMEWLAGSMGN